MSYPPKIQSINSPPLLEIACFNISSAIAAAQAGADRIELCSSPAEGGTTPSYGTIKLTLEKIVIPVFPIIRPRGGDFIYNDDEFEVMLHDVQICKQLNCKGIVTGLLQTDGSVDVQRTAILVQAAGQMPVTFHRAFDRAIHPLQALEDVIATGCQRLLTSGQKSNATEGKYLIKELITQAANRIIIIPGGGVRSHNITELANCTGAIEFHSSARMPVPSAMEFFAKDFDEDAEHVGVDSKEIETMKMLMSGYIIK